MFFLGGRWSFGVGRFDVVRRAIAAPVGDSRAFFLCDGGVPSRAIAAAVRKPIQPFRSAINVRSMGLRLVAEGLHIGRCKVHEKLSLRDDLFSHTTCTLEAFLDALIFILQSFPAFTRNTARSTHCSTGNHPSLSP